MTRHTAQQPETSTVVKMVRKGIIAGQIGPTDMIGSETFFTGHIMCDVMRENRIYGCCRF